MKRLMALGAVMAASMAFSGCARIEELAGGSERVTDWRPAPTPAIDFWEAKRKIDAWAAAYNAAAERYDPGALAKIETGALREEHRTEFKIAKHNDVRLSSMHRTSDLRIPRFIGWPKWFIARVVSTGRERVDGEAVFVQEKKGAPWRAVSLAWIAGTDLGQGAYPRADAVVVPPSDATLVIAPGRLAEAHAHAIRYGEKSPYAGLFHTSARTAEDHERLMDGHKKFRRGGWPGRFKVSGSPHPMYVLRTGSGGALAFYSLDVTSRYRRARGLYRLSWTRSDVGKVYPALIGREWVTRQLTAVERVAYATYIPPKGKGKIHVLASRSAVVRVEGY